MGRGYCSVWWLNLCDNVARLSDTLIAGKPLFLDVSLKVFLEGIILTSAVSIVQYFESLNRTKSWRQGDFALCWIGTLVFSSSEALPLLVLGPLTQIKSYRLASLGSQVFRFGLDLYQWLFCISSLQMTDHEISPSS